MRVIMLPVHRRFIDPNHKSLGPRSNQMHGILIPVNSIPQNVPWPLAFYSELKDGIPDVRGCHVGKA